MMAVFAVAAITVGSQGEGSRAELRSRLERAADVSAFSFSYVRRGARVVDCVLPHTRFVLDVDVPRATTLARSVEGSLLASANNDAILMHRRLFEDPPFPTAWLEVRRDELPAVEAGVRRTLGDDLAGYLLTESPPPAPRDLVLAALAVASDVDDLPATHIRGVEATGFRIKLSGSILESAIPGDALAPSSTLAPTMDAWLGSGGAILRVTVRAGEHDVAGAAEVGWALDYRYQRRFAPLADGGRATSVTAIDSAQLRPARRPCQLPG